MSNNKFAEITFIMMLGQKKNFGSGQLIFENWSGGLVDAFLYPSFPNLMNVLCATTI